MAPSAVLGLHIEYCCQFFYERPELVRTAGAPLNKLLRERLVRRRIEESNGAPNLAVPSQKSVEVGLQ